MSSVETVTAIGHLGIISKRIVLDFVLPRHIIQQGGGGGGGLLSMGGRICQILKTNTIIKVHDGGRDS